MVSQAWKTLSIDEREVWEEMARRDKARYEVEKKFYNGPWKVLATKRTQKDPNAPKRPMSAFLAFSNLKRAEVKEDNPGLGNSERSRVLAKMWKEAPEDERKNYIDKEYKLRQTYKTAIAEWRRNSEGVMQAARKEREDEALRTVLGTADKGGPRLSSKDGGKISPHSAIIEPHPLEPNDGRHSHHHQHHFQYAQQHPHPNTAPPSMPLIEENRDSFHGQQHQHYPSYTSSGLQGSSYPQDPSAHGKSNGNDPDAAPPAGETQIEGSAVPYQPPPTVDSYYHQHGGNVPTYYYGAGEKGGPSSGGGDYNYGYGQPYYPQHGGDGHDYYQQHPHLPYGTISTSLLLVLSRPFPQHNLAHCCLLLSCFDRLFPAAAWCWGLLLWGKQCTLCAS
jgi:hypothetical protein